MNAYEKAKQRYREANANFWAVHDRLVMEGVAEDGLDALTSHPDYVAADRAVSEAYRAAVALEEAREGNDD